MSKSLALSTLQHEWRRFLPAIFAVAFSGLLVLVQIGLLLGILALVAVCIETSSADLWVAYRGTPSVDMPREMDADMEVYLRMHPEVASVEEMFWTMAEWHCASGVTLTTRLTGVDVSPGAMGLSKKLPASLRMKLNEPMTVAVDEADRARLGVQPGDCVEVNRQKVRVVGITHGLRTVGGINVTTSATTARTLCARPEVFEKATYFLLKLRHPEAAAAVRDALQQGPAAKKYSVFLSPEFTNRTEMYWLLESGAGLSIGFSSLLGLIVGAVITSQTLVGAIIASLREYAALRALGVSVRSLSLIVLEQSTWIGVIGLGFTALATFVTIFAAGFIGVSLAMPGWAIGMTCGLVLMLALGSGLWALRALYAAEPASLLR